MTDVIDKSSISDDNYTDLVIITTTFYGEDDVSEVRSLIACETLRRINDLGIKCVVVDGGSTREFIEQIDELENIVVIIDSSLGMGESRRKALEIAMTQFPESNYYLWMEPEKDDLIKETSIKSMLAPLQEGQTDIVVPKRESLDSYPKFQRKIEQRANKRVSDSLNIHDSEGKDLDLWFGPKMFNREGAKYFLNYKSKLDKWDSIIAPVVEGQRDGAKIKSVDVDYKYDVIQELHEQENPSMNRKRIDQYTKILPELGDEYWANRGEKNVK